MTDCDGETARPQKRKTLYQVEEIREASKIACDPELFVLLNRVFAAGARGQFPMGEVVVGRAEKAKRFTVPDNPFSRGMIAVLAELRARGIKAGALTAYMMRTIAFMDVLQDPGEASEFVRAGDTPGQVVFSESLVRACAMADYVFAESDHPRLDTRSVLEHTQKFEAEAAALDQLETMLPEAPCPCGSGRKLKNCCMKRTTKPRSVSLMVAFDRPVSTSGIGIMPDGAVRLFGDDPGRVESAFIETTYERAKGKKVVHRLPVDPSSISIDRTAALLRFDRIFALDTNTRLIGSSRVSVAALVLGRWRSRSPMPILEFAPTQAIELRNTDCSPDLVAWRMFFALLEANPDRASMGRVGVIVDAHLDSLNVINSRQSAILDDFFLPNGSTLMYASSDAGVVESVMNKLLSLADKYASELLDEIERSGAITLQSQRPDVPHASYMRVWKRSELDPNIEPVEHGDA